jgi:hypothetical protein
MDVLNEKTFQAMIILFSTQNSKLFVSLIICGFSGSETLDFYTVRPVPTSTLIDLERVESSSAESNMLHLGRIQVRKSNKTDKYKCASPEAYLT